jgi:hypothetical protein
MPRLWNCPKKCPETATDKAGFDNDKLLLIFQGSTEDDDNVNDNFMTNYNVNLINFENITRTSY